MRASNNTTMYSGVSLYNDFGANFIIARSFRISAVGVRHTSGVSRVLGQRHRQLTYCGCSSSGRVRRGGSEPPYPVPTLARNPISLLARASFDLLGSTLQP